MLLGINRSNIKAVHRTGFLARWTANFCHIYKYEESKKSFNVIPKHWQILSIVSTLNCPPRRAVLWIVEYDIPHFFVNTHRFISRSCIKSWTRLIVSTKIPPIFLVQNFSNDLKSLLWRYKDWRIFGVKRNQNRLVMHHAIAVGKELCLGLVWGMFIVFFQISAVIIYEYPDISA